MVPVPIYRDILRNQESPTKGGFLPLDAGLKVAPSAAHIASLGPQGASSKPDPIVAIVGVGFVGESLLKAFAGAFSCIAYDISLKRIAALRPQFAQPKQLIEFTTDPGALSRADCFLISVPTLLRSDRSVNLDYVHSAIDTVLSHARSGSTIVLESSVSVGTTRRLLSGYASTHHIGMSPERVDPGRTTPAAHAIPKLVSGLTPAALAHIKDIYGRVFDAVVPVSNVETAELTKLFENCFRMVNIAYVDEMADFALRHGVDPAEMVAAAATKPYGFMPFTPGLGVGGHCIPVNPYYLFDDGASQLPVLERATRTMWARPRKMARKFYRRAMFASVGPHKQRSTVSVQQQHRRPRILVVGIGFKRGQSVLSCSPGLAFAEALRGLGCARLAFYDPLVAGKDVEWMEKLEACHWEPGYLETEFDGVAVCGAQDGVDLKVLEGLRGTFIRSWVYEV